MEEIKLGSDKLWWRAAKGSWQERNINSELPFVTITVKFMIPQELALEQDLPGRISRSFCGGFEQIRHVFVNPDLLNLQSSRWNLIIVLDQTRNPPPFASPHLTSLTLLVTPLQNGSPGNKRVHISNKQNRPTHR